MDPPRAGFGARAAASLLDVLVLLPALGIYVAVLYSLDANNKLTPNVEYLIDVSGSVFGVVYTTFEIFTAGTPGKLMLGLRIRDETGNAAHAARLTRRWLIKNGGTVVSVAGVALGMNIVERTGDLIGLLIVVGFLFTLRESRQAWYDEWAGTAVYRRKDLESPRGFQPLVGETKGA